MILSSKKMFIAACRKGSKTEMKTKNFVTYGSRPMYFFFRFSTHIYQEKERKKMKNRVFSLEKRHGFEASVDDRKQ